MLDSRPALEKVVLDKSVDHRLRSRAARTLGQIEDPRSEGVLLKVLKDEYPVMLTLRMIEEMGFDRCTSDDETDPGGPHLGILRGPFPIPELIKAIHLISVFSVMQMQSDLQAGWSHDERRDCIPPAPPSRNTS